jgi:hypothetical protein
VEKRSGFSGTSRGQENGRQTKEELSFHSLNNRTIPENTLFNITSLIFNLENNKEEVHAKFNCFFSPGLEALCIMIEDSMKYKDLSKEIVINLMDFAQKMNIKNLVLLLARKNKDYVKLLQGMMTVGFQSDPALKNQLIQDKEYKILKMIIKKTQNEIEEVFF